MFPEARGLSLGRPGLLALRWWHTGTRAGWIEEGLEVEDPTMALAAAPTEAPREAAEAVEADGPASVAAIGHTEDRLLSTEQTQLFICIKSSADIVFF